MPQTLSREAAPQLLHYRPWRGTLRSPRATIWPIARTALSMMVRRRLFWVLYGLGLLFFLLFFFGQYLFAFAEAQAPDPNSRNSLNLRDVVDMIRNALKLDGSGESYRTFIDYQSRILMVILALAGSIIIGNDLRFGSLPYYLSKSLSRWHYLSGKALAVAAFVNLLTTIPALILFVQYGLVKRQIGWEYFENNWQLVFGILGYGAVLTASLSLFLLATAMWLRKTVPLIMVWSTLFFFCRVVCDTVVERLDFNKHWRLFDLWNDMFLVGSKCLSAPLANVANQPAWYMAALVLGGVCLVCLTYLILRIRAVEIVR
jgi:ABC-type transport system involved in multi-copper enzyme maturation permease subunit